ncbi:trypsin-like peptidase domain-containing protein [Kitasatospora sp. NPDC004289]
MARTYPAECELVEKVASTVWGHHREVHGIPVLAVTYTHTGERVAPAVVVSISEPVMKIRHADLKREAAQTMAPLDVLLDEIHGDIMRRTGVVVSVIAVPPPVHQVAPSDIAHCGEGPGTFGVRVTTPQGTRGLLTAGHAAPTAGVAAYDTNAQRLGSVGATKHCAIVLARQETADVALIELDAATPDTQRATPPISVIGTGHKWDQVTAFGAVTSGQWAALLTAGHPFAGPDGPGGGDWGQTMMTAYAISAPGDSGAPVYNQQNELIGHVVGGYPGVYSVIQDANYQLTEVGASPR